MMLSNLKCTRQCLKATSQSFLFQRSVHGKKTHYDVLKIPKTATSDQIRKAYIKRCKELHPDRNINDPQTHNRMVRLNEAYQCLSKKSSKDDYDRKLNMGINITESYYPSAQQRPYTPPRPDAANYGAWQQTYYGASREDRAQRERDYYRRVQEEIVKEWNSGARKTTNESIFNGGLIIFTVITAYLAYVYFDYVANAERLYWQEQQKSEKTNEGIRFSNSIILPFIFGLSAFFTGAVLQSNASRRQMPIRAEAMHEFWQQIEKEKKLRREEKERLNSFRMVNMYFRGAFIVVVIVMMTGNIIRYWYGQSENDKRRQPGSLYAKFCALYLIIASTGIVINIARHHYDNWAQRNMHHRELNRADRIYFSEGASYPRPLRRNGRHSSSSDIEEEKEIRS